MIIIKLKLWWFKRKELKRCQREIDEIVKKKNKHHSKLAWPNAIGHADWLIEIWLIKKEFKNKNANF